MRDTTKAFIVLGAFVASGTTLTDESLAGVTDTFNSITSAITIKNNNTRLKVSHVSDNNGNCFAVSKVGTYATSIKVPCND